MKPISFHGDSLDAIRAFPETARRNVGFQLEQVQRGDMPGDFKPMSTVGAGAYEIRVRDGAGAFRVIYVAKLEDAVHVLHAFQKKTQRTAPADLELACKRYSELTHIRNRKS